MNSSSQKNITPILTKINTRSNSKNLQCSTSSNDLMETLQSFPKEFLRSVESQSTVHISKFNELKCDLKELSSLVTDLKAENTILKEDILARSIQ
ncbi:unnamed protein product [Macrosiphum euphorbiae]|uniref:Uncharacterized protein n=1 Tax=Macrosiphum euphorbiae TaxID=13131 RepID=A0AAV0WFT2_9HEMI|nr:unnamed protein product [Macrosiphum euphorbiae]